jgi:hypothetical protein
LQLRGWQFGDPARAIELALAGGDIPLAAFKQFMVVTALSRRQLREQCR